MKPSSIHITQGEHATGSDPEVMISTLLGSCVACCLWDPDAGIGGMNHLLISTRGAAEAHCDTLGVNAMELLINDMVKLGAKRANLRAKAFGGARMVTGLSDIGDANARFVLAFLEREGIRCERHSLGGEAARMLKFWPATGRVLQKIACRDNVQVEREVVADRVGNSPEIF